MPRQPSLFLLTDCLGIQFFDSTLFSQGNQLDYLWWLIPDCASPMWLTGRYATPLFIKSFPTNPHPGKQRISIGVKRTLRTLSIFMPLLKNLMYFSPKVLYMVGPICVLESPHRPFISISRLLSQLFKSSICW